MRVSTAMCRGIQMLVLLGAGFAVSPLTAQIYPLSENTWKNPDFVRRFMGSYGVNTDVEPTLSREEGSLFEALAPLLTEGSFESAAQRLRSAVKADSSAALNYTLGSIYLQLDQKSQAIEQYERAIHKFPNFLRAYKNLGLTYLQEERFDAALPHIRKAIELGDKDPNTFGFLGYIYLNQGLYDSAIDAYSYARMLMPENRDWKVGRVSALIEAGYYDKAIPSLEELITQEPDTAQFYTSIANAYIATGAYQQAAQYLELLRRLNRADARALVLLGDIYTNEDLPDLAVDTYEKALEKGGSVSSEILARAVRALISRSAYTDALRLIDIIERARGGGLSEPIELDLLNARSQIAFAQGNRESALQALESVIGRDPLNGRALMLLGSAKLEEEDFESAEFYLQRAEKVVGFEAESLVQQGRMKVAQKLYPEAIRLLERAQALRPQTNVAQFLEAIRSVHLPNQ